MNPKEAARLKRKKRIKKKIGGGERLRLSVFRSCKHIYARIAETIVDRNNTNILTMFCIVLSRDIFYIRSSIKFRCFKAKYCENIFMKYVITVEY